MQHRLIYVYGLPGTGKTTCIENYLDQNQDQYDTCMLFNLNESPKITADAIELIFKTGVSWIIIESPLDDRDLRRDLKKLAKHNSYEYIEECTNAPKIDAEFIAKLKKRIGYSIPEALVRSFKSS